MAEFTIYRDRTTTVWTGGPSSMGRGRGYGRPPWMECPPFGGGHWHGGRRMRRGEIRFALLSVLAEGPGDGYELIGRLEAETRGAGRARPRAGAPTLQAPP